MCANDNVNAAFLKKLNEHAKKSKFLFQDGSYSLNFRQALKD